MLTTDEISEALDALRLELYAAETGEQHADICAREAELVRMLEERQ